MIWVYWSFYILSYPVCHPCIWGVGSPVEPSQYVADFYKKSIVGTGFNNLDILVLIFQSVFEQNIHCCRMKLKFSCFDPLVPFNWSSHQLSSLFTTWVGIRFQDESGEQKESLLGCDQVFNGISIGFQWKFNRSLMGV